MDLRRCGTQWFVHLISHARSLRYQMYKEEQGGMDHCIQSIHISISISQCVPVQWHMGYLGSLHWTWYP